MRIRYLLFIFLVLLFFANIEAQEDLELNPFLTQEEREVFRERPKYERFIGPKLSAILYNPGNSKAVIDGKIVREGDTVDGKKVLQISPNWVILTDLQRKFILEIERFVPSSGMVIQKKDE